MKEKEIKEKAIEEIQVVLQSIRNSKIKRIRRVVGDMLQISFGEMVQYEEEMIPRYSFHLQCSFRFIKGTDILLTSRDMYLPASKFYGDKFKWEDYDDSTFEWDVVGNNAFDENLLKLKKDGILNARVRYASVDVNGDLNINFNDGMILETYLTTNLIYESWRALDMKEDIHYVFFQYPDE